MPVGYPTGKFELKRIFQAHLNIPLKTWRKAGRLALAAGPGPNKSGCGGLNLMVECEADIRFPGKAAFR